MPSQVKVGIQISAVDNTRRALASVKRNFATMQRQFASVNKLGSIGNMSSQFRKVRREVMATAGVSRRFIAGTGTGAELIASRALPKLEKGLKKAGKTNSQVARTFADNWNSIGGVFSNAYITAFIFFRLIQSGASYMARATIDNEKYIKTLVVLEGSLEMAHLRMKQMHEIARLPAIQAPQAAESFIKLKSVGLTSVFSTQIIEEFSNAMAIAGGTSRDMSESIRQLGQMMSTGKIDMENFRVILERMPTIRQAVQKTFGPGAVHTDVLQTVLDKEELTAEGAWQKIFETMQEGKRADPTTLANRVESLQDSIWELSSILGNLWTPNFKWILEQMTSIVDGFNNLSKPVRDFIGWMGSAVGLISVLGVTLFAVSKMWKVAKEPFSRFFGVFKGFKDRNVYGDGRRGVKAERRFGARPSITFRDLTDEHRKRRGIFASSEDREKGPLKTEMEEYAKEADKNLSDLRGDLNTQKTKFTSAYAENERKMREVVDAELLNSTLLGQEETRKSEALTEYNRRLEDVTSKIQTEQDKIERHVKNKTKAEIELTERYKRHFVEHKKAAKKINHWITTGEPIEKGVVDNFLWHSKNMDELRNQMKSPISSAGEVHKLQKELTDAQINRTRVYTETGNKLFKQHAKPILKQYQKDLTETLIKEAAEAERAALKDHGHQFTEDDYKEIAEKAHKDVRDMGLTVDDLPKEYAETVRQKVKPELDKAMKEINEVVKQTQADLDSALDQGNQGRLKALHTELANLQDGYDEFERSYVESTAELDRKIAEDNVRRASYIDEHGKRIFHDPETEDKIKKGQKDFAKQWSDNTRRLKKEVQKTDNLAKRAWANFRSIDHLDNFVEMAYGGLIGVGIAAGTVALTALINHFKNLKSATEEYADLVRDRLPDFLEFRDMLSDWGKAERILKGGVEPIGSELARSYADERRYLSTIQKEHPDVFFEFQRKRLSHINKVLRDRGIELDEYRRKYWEKERERLLDQLADPRFQAKAVENFQRVLSGYTDKETLKSVKGLREELEELDKLDTNIFEKVKFTDLFSEQDIKNLAAFQRAAQQFIDSDIKWWDIGGQLGQGRTQHALNKELERYAKLLTDKGYHIDANTKNLRDYLKAFNRIQDAEEDLDRLKKAIDRVNEAFAKGKALVEAMSIEMKDVGDWGYRRTGVESRIAEIRDTFFHFHVPMQKVLSDEVSHLERIVKLEDTADKLFEKSNPKRQKLYDKYNIYRWVDKNREEITEAIATAGKRGKELSIFDVIGEIGDPGRVTTDHKRVLASVGQKSLQSLLKEVTRISISQAFDDLGDASQETQDEINEIVRDIAQTHEEYLVQLRQSFQSYMLDGDQLKPVFEVAQVSRYLATLKEIRDTIDDTIERDKFTESIRQQEVKLDKAKEELDVWNKVVELIKTQQGIVGDSKHFTGFSDERLSYVENQIRQSQEHERQRIDKLLEGLRYFGGFIPIDGKEFEASAGILANIKKTTTFIVGNVEKWAKYVADIDKRMASIKGSFYDEKKGIQRVLSDELDFLARLQEAIPDYIDIFQVRADNKNMRKISAEINEYKKEMADLIKQVTAVSGIADITPESIEEMVRLYQTEADKPSKLLSDYDLKILKDKLKLAAEVIENYKKIPDLERRLKEAQGRSVKFLESEEMVDLFEEYLRGVRSSITELNTLPAQMHQKQLALANEQDKQFKAGSIAAQLQSIHNAKEDIKTVQDQIEVRKKLVDVFEDTIKFAEELVGLSPERLKWLKFTKEQLKLINDEVQKLIDFQDKINNVTKLDKAVSVIDQYKDLPSQIYKERLEFAKLQRTVPKPGDLASHEESLFNARKQLELLIEQNVERSKSVVEYNKLIDMFPKQEKWVRVILELMGKINDENSKMVGHYERINNLRIQDSVNNVFETMFSLDMEKPKVSKFIERINKIGKDELDLQRTDLYDYPSPSTVWRDNVKAQKDLKWELQQARRFYRIGEEHRGYNEAGKKWFREQLLKEFRAEGLMPTAEEIDDVMQRFDAKREDLYEEVRQAVEARTGDITHNLGNLMKNAIGAKARRHIIDFLRDTIIKPIDFAFDEMWERYVDMPLDYKRQIEDIREDTEKSIHEVQNSTRAGVRAGHSDQVMSARQRRDAIRDILKDEADQIEQIQKDQEKADKRMWEDRMNRMKKYFAEFAKEQLKIRYIEPLLNRGLDALEKGLDWIGLDKLKPQERSTLPVTEPGYWKTGKEHIEHGMKDMVDSFAKEMVRAENQASRLAKSHDYASKAAELLARSAKWAAEQLKKCTCVSDEPIPDIVNPDAPSSVKERWWQTDVDPAVVTEFVGKALSEVFKGGVKADFGVPGEPRGSISYGPIQVIDPDTGEVIPFEETHDHPLNDRRMRMMGYKQAASYNKRLGFSTAQDMRGYFELGFEERLKGYESKPTNTRGGGGDGNLISELRDIRDAVVELQDITSEVSGRPVNVNIGDRETRKINHNDTKMYKQKRVIRRR